MSNIHKHQTSNLRATYFALFVSITLAISKFLNYFLTGSVAIQASALDSLMDVAVSFANFVAIKFTQKEANSRFPMGYDKIAALIAFLQVILVIVLSVFLLHECVIRLFEQNFEIEHFGYGIAIICFALFLNTLLVHYQNKVISETGSIIITADRLHFQTDFLTNSSILLGFLFIWFFKIYWLDAVLGIAASFYLLYSVYFLMIDSLASLLDMSDVQAAKEVFEKIQQFDGVKKEDVYFLFSGTQNIIKIHYKGTQAMDLRMRLEKFYPNAKISIIS